MPAIHKYALSHFGAVRKLGDYVFKEGQTKFKGKDGGNDKYWPAFMNWVQAAPAEYEFKGKKVKLGTSWNLTKYKARNTCGNMMESLLGLCELAEHFSKMTAKEIWSYLEGATDSAISGYRAQWPDIIRIAWIAPIDPSWRPALEEICTGKFDLFRFKDKPTQQEPWGAWPSPAYGSWA